VEEIRAKLAVSREFNINYLEIDDMPMDDFDQACIMLGEIYGKK
tara:strand:+ start:323 stop:454 length:132 start_codon:yes stop_codon:yes gene_type:complete